MNEENTIVDEDKKNEDNAELDVNEPLPAPEVEEAKEGSIDPDFIPAPEEEEEYLPDITPDMVREEMMGVDEDGYSRCIIHVELKKVPNYNPEFAEDANYEEGPADAYINYEDEEEDEPENTIPIADVDVEYCRVREYTLDGNIENLELIFDNPLDKGMQEVHQMLEEYRVMCDEFDKAEIGEGDLPIFSIYFMPIKYPSQAIAAFAQPFAFFKTIGFGDDEERILHMMFPIERTGITCYHVKKEEIDQLEEYVVSRINEGGTI